MRSGSHRRMVGITFDDGYVSVLEAALPELQRHGFGATAFIISDRLGSTNDWDEGPAWPLMQADEVREPAGRSTSRSARTARRTRLAGADPDRPAAEVQATRLSLGALTGTEIRGFAYPYGSMDTAAQRTVQAAGYEYACAVETPAAAIGIMAIPRVYRAGWRVSDGSQTAPLQGAHRAERKRPVKVLQVITGLRQEGQNFSSRCWCAVHATSQTS